MGMKNKTLLVFIFLVLISAGGYFVFDNDQQNNTPEVTSNSTQSSPPQSVEDLVKRSANEMVEPKSANSNGTVKGETISDICVTQQVQTFGCYEDYYVALVKNKGVTVAFGDLKARYDQNSYIKSQCHPIVHVIGSTATQLYPDVGTAYTKGDSFCWSGYYHGVMEGIIAQISREELASKMNGICGTIPGKASYSFDYYNCVHGLGHGVMAISQNELFDSLKLCDNLVGSWEQSSCHSGAFMENVIVDNKNHYTKYLKPDEPLYPCTVVEDKYKGTCYLMQTSYMLKVTGGDFEQVFELCRQVGNFSATCYQSLGRDASGRNISNVDSTKATCALGKDFDQKSNCIVGAVKDFVSYHHSDVQAKQLCTALEQELQSICFSTIESYYTTFK